jgi:hypothetical protein
MQATLQNQGICSDQTSQICLISYCLFCDIESSTAECENTSNASPSDTAVEGVEPFFNFEQDFMYGAPGWGHEARVLVKKAIRAL